MNGTGQRLEEDVIPVDGHIDQQDKRNLTLKQWFEHIYATYGFSVTALLVFVFFNMGLRILINLTIKDYFK